MLRHLILEQAHLASSPERVYAILADYRQGHPHIVPRPPFGELVVEEGGYGAGTVIRYTIVVLGKTHTVRASITEPEPGRVLVETDLSSGNVTTFTVKPGPKGCIVTISTDMNIKRGLVGMAQRYFFRRLLQPLYRKELHLLEEFAQQSLPAAP